MIFFLSLSLFPSVNGWDIQSFHSIEAVIFLCHQYAISVPRRVFVVGVMKKPVDYDLRDPHDASWLKEKLDQSEDALNDDSTVKAYLELFSCMLDSEKGMRFLLSSHKHFRFFRLDLFRKRIYMSLAVALTQRLSEDGQEPHVLQAFLYMVKLENNEREFSQDMANQVRVDADLVQYDIKLPKSKKRERVPGARTDSGRQSVSAKGTVIDILRNSDYIGKLGHGNIDSEEYEHDGLRIAIKIGHPFNEQLHEEADPCALVSNEVDVHKHLKHLQGTVIPALVSCGRDKWFTSGGMILITEKVGNKIKKGKDGLYVVGEKLSEKEADEVERCALVGLKRIHASNIRHGDIALRDLRVEKLDGRMRIWRIDFGMSRNLNEDSEEEGIEEAEIEQRKAGVVRI